MEASGPVLGRFAEPVSNHRIRLGVLSDLHLSTHQRGSDRVLHRTESRLESAVCSLNRQQLDAVFFVGDLVQNGYQKEFDVFDRLISELDAPFFAVPGNHDLIEGDSEAQLTLPEFESRYTPAGLPFRTQVGGVAVIGISTNTSTAESLAESYAGAIGQETLNWLPEIVTDVSYPVVLHHHTLSGVRDHYRDGREMLPVKDGSDPGFENAEELIYILRKNGGALVLTGHLHFPAVIQAADSAVREFVLPPLGPFPCGYTVLEITGQGMTAVFNSVADFDESREALDLGVENNRTLASATRIANAPLTDTALQSDCHDR